MDEISQDTGKYCFGVEDTLKALDLGAVEDLIIWENLEIMRLVMRNTTDRTTSVTHLLNMKESKVSTPRMQRTKLA